MSLINQMLKDLEQRRTAAAGGEQSPLRAVVRDVPPTRRNLAAAVGVTVILTLGAAGGAYWLFLRPALTPIAVDPPAHAASSRTTPAEITGAKPPAGNAGGDRKTTTPPATQAGNEPAPAGEPSRSEQRAGDEPPVRTRQAEPNIAATAPVSTADIATRTAGAEGGSATPATAAKAGPPAGETGPRGAGIDPPRGSSIKTPARLSPAEQAAAAYREGMKLSEAGRLSEAAARFNAALQADPDYHAGREALAAALLRSGRTAAAEDALREGMQRSPEHLAYVKRYANLRLAQNDTLGALASLHAAPAPDLRADPDFHALLAAVEQRANNHAAAAEAYRELVAVRPDRGIWWVGLGISLEQMQQPAEALAVYRRARAAGGLPPQVAQYVTERIQALE